VAFAFALLNYLYLYLYRFHLTFFSAVLLKRVVINNLGGHLVSSQG